MYGVQNNATGEVKDVHVVRLRFYGDKDLEMTTGSKEVFNMLSHSANLRWPGSSTFRRPKTDRILTSKWTKLDSMRERVRGSHLGLYGRRILSNGALGVL